MSGDRIESLVSEGIDRIALPPESEWLPDVSRARARQTPRWFAVPVALSVVLAAVMLGSGLRSVREAPATQPPASQAPAIVPSGPTQSPEPTRGPDESWQQLRRQLPSVPMIEPTWLPPVFDGVKSVMSAVTSSNPSDTYYTVSYTAGRDTVIFALRGSTAPTAAPARGGSGMGSIVVRRSPATLEFPVELYANPRADGQRFVSWTEGSYSLHIESQTISGDDLLRIAWSLDQTGAPGAPAVRAKPGACADAGAAEETIRRLVSLIGRRDRDALADCFASEAVGLADSWNSLPSATLDSIVPIHGVGGRRQLQVNWTFASDPGGPWNLHAGYSFLMGREDGLWRVFGVGSASFGTPP